jgi:hypothetical protein
MDVLYQTDLKLMVALGTSVPTVFNSFDFFDTYLDTTCNAPYSTSDLISQPNSNAFIDFDGDCKQDLLLTRTSSETGDSYYQVFIQTVEDNKPKYCLSQTSNLSTSDETVPLISISDFDRDGMFDLIYPRFTAGTVDTNPSGEVVILLNQL